jgi:hypothetical protein
MAPLFRRGRNGAGPDRPKGASAFFRGRNRSGPNQAAAAVKRFWSWWVIARHEVAVAIDRGAHQQVRGLIEPKARGLHQDLAWYVGPGVQARYMLVLTGSRRPDLRPLTERWRRAGPPDDATWEYHPAAPAEPDAFAGPVASTAMIYADDRRCRLDLTVFHPVFDQLDEADRNRVADVLVGWALGEDETDRWIGEIDTSTDRPLDSVPVAMLASVTSQLTDRWGGDRWSMIEGSFGDRRLIAAVRHPLHRVDHPLLDQHLAVRLPYRETTPDGLPSRHALDELLYFEEALVARLRGQALFVAHQTTSGERLLHFYADSTASPIPIVRASLNGYPGPTPSVLAQLDPGWESIGHLRT